MQHARPRAEALSGIGGCPGGALPDAGSRVSVSGRITTPCRTVGGPHRGVACGSPSRGKSRGGRQVASRARQAGWAARAARYSTQPSRVARRPPPPRAPAPLRAARPVPHPPPWSSDGRTGTTCTRVRRAPCASASRAAPGGQAAPRRQVGRQGDPADRAGPAPATGSALVRGSALTGAGPPAAGGPISPPPPEGTWPARAPGSASTTARPAAPCERAPAAGPCR